MKHLLYALFTLLALHSFSQKDSSRFYAGIVFSPDYCYRTLYLNGSDDVQFIIDKNNNWEVPKFGFTAGFSGLWRFSKRFELAAGVVYSNKGYRTKELSLGGMFGIASTQSHYIYHCIDIPAGIHFVAGKKRWQFIASLAATTNVFLRETAKTDIRYTNGETASQRGKTSYEYRLFWLTGEAGAGASYHFNGRFELRAIPCFRYGITPINDTPITGRLWSAGLTVACYYRL